MNSIKSDIDSGIYVVDSNVKKVYNINPGYIWNSITPHVKGTEKVINNYKHAVINNSNAGGASIQNISKNMDFNESHNNIHKHIKFNSKEMNINSTQLDNANGITEVKNAHINGPIGSKYMFNHIDKNINNINEINEIRGNIRNKKISNGGIKNINTIR